MKAVSVVLALCALIAGLVAAWKWYKASKVLPEPTWKFEPVDETLKAMGMNAAIFGAFQQSGALNAQAALWTGASVALGGVSTVLNSLS